MCSPCRETPGQRNQPGRSTVAIDIPLLVGGAALRVIVAGVQDRDKMASTSDQPSR
jgi:hypothetical protein